MNSDPIGAYIQSLAEDAAKLREQHGGKRRWWVRHSANDCVYCLAHKNKHKPRTRVNITKNIMFDRVSRTSFEKLSYEHGKRRKRFAS